MYLLLQKSVLHELVDQGEHHGVGHGLGLEARTGGQGQQHAGREQVEQNRRSQQVHPHFTLPHGKFLGTAR
jgi:hypothetical protein